MGAWLKAPGCAGWRIGAGVVFAATLLPAPDASAQSSYTLLKKFYSGARIPIGRLVEGPDGSLFGTTYCGGEPASGCFGGGTLFALRPRPDGTWAFETLHHLRMGLHGGNPAGGLTLTRDGSLYGIATTRGLPLPALSTGTIFRLSPTGSLAAVHVFPGEQIGIDGEDPIGRLLEGSDGNLYGATCNAGRYGPQSTIFRLRPDGSLTTIHSFRYNETRNLALPFNPVDGWCPMTQLTEAGGFLYGTAVAGGASIPFFPQFPPSGTLFRLDPRTTPAPVTVLHTFHGLDGARPTGAMTPGAAGDFFGTTAAGGLFGQGVVYRRDASGAVRTVHTFSGGDGSAPFGSLFRSSDGSFFGTTLRGGLGHGTVFRLGATGFSSLHRFTGNDGSGPVEVIRARDGNLYGATAAGGPGGGGTLFQLKPDNSFATLHAFSGGPRGPADGVVQATDGNFYGTTDGGSFGAGTVYRMTPSGQVTILHEFAPPPPSGRADPWVAPGPLMQAADGFLYGRTTYGGAHNWGILYRISTAGAFTVLHSFTNFAGAEPLLQGSDGNLYGVDHGDSAAEGRIFRVNSSGAVSTLYDFAGTGTNPAPGPIAEGPDGALYGNAFGPGAFNVGGLYKVTTAGALTLLHSFEAPSEVGFRPVSGLIRSADGGLYGTTTQSHFGLPSIYRFDPATNTIAAVARLQTDGVLLEGRDGAIYGRTGYGDAPRPLARFFRLVAGNIEYLYDMIEADGLNPSALIQGADGALYGTVAEGPSRWWEPETWPVDTFAGGVFRLVVPPLPSGGSVARASAPK